MNLSDIRLGVTVQYAEVEEDEITVTRQIEKRYLDGQLMTSEVTSETSEIDAGNRVYGGEFSVFVRPLVGWTTSAELHGFLGNNTIQGAIGTGYDFKDGLYISVKALFPYSEIGLRLLAPFELYVGVNTLGAFNPEHSTKVEEVVIEKREKSEQTMVTKMEFNVEMVTPVFTPHMVEGELDIQMATPVVTPFVADVSDYSSSSTSFSSSYSTSIWTGELTPPSNTD